MKKIKYILQLLCLVFYLSFIVGTGIFIDIERNRTDCILVYIESGQQEGSIYMKDFETFHIEGKLNDVQEEYIAYLGYKKIWEAKGCYMKTWMWSVDLVNSNYCYWAKFYLWLWIDT